MKQYRSILTILLTMMLAYQVLANNNFEQLPKALEDEMMLLDKKERDSLILLRERADLLEEEGDPRKVYGAYLDLIEFQDSIEQNIYIHKINQFKTEYQAKQNSVLNRQLSTKSEYLYLLILILVLFAGVLGTLIFINRRLKKKLLSVRESAERSDKLKSAFLANMNHEIRTPLNAIAGFSQLLADETDVEICEQYINIIKNNNDLLMNLLNDVLDISRIESNDITFTYSKVFLPQLVNGLSEMAKLQVSPSVAIIKDSVPDLYIYTDKNRLTQVLSNLISNAIKHTSEGSITIGYELSGDDMVHFHVIDTGEGVAEDLQDKIFARFVQAVEAQSKGVGLGLALCKGFIEHLGGKIGVISKEGKGSTFWFTLPVRMPDDKK